MTLPVYSLGAIELIELGKSRRAKPSLSARKPFFKKDIVRPFIGNSDQALGQMDLLIQLGSFLAKFLSSAFSVLAQIVNVPVDILASDVDALFTNVAGLIGEVPILGTLAAQIFLVSNSIIKFGLQVPDELLDGISNVLAGIGKALDAIAPSERADAENDAKDMIMERAPDRLKEAVQAALSGDNPVPPGRGLGSGGSPGATTPTATGASSGAVGAGSRLETAVVAGAVIAAGGTLLLLVT